MNDKIRHYTVLVNDAGQYALHPDGTGAPRGWCPAGFTGTEEECARHVDEHWTDTRPPHLRRTAVL
ncbi:MbtH family NRPS accessory protein [Streptosporangium lutulentum]|uniref:MbtH protein n=1 Tax=Streptosporangium lutulentum TaxID=1461250 RepID=A0ABT9QUE6_9ACTN|nr:MbtH family NRPS accessory protein [Streptosporangium lutulentum]MDP9850026.1 MbtH protein [Streptosporangium lutulentum]